MKSLTLMKNTPLRFDDEKELVCLTDLWKAVKGSVSQKPNHWLHLDDTKKFINTVAKKLNTAQDCIYL